MSFTGQVIKSVGNKSVVITANGRRVDCTLAGKYRLENLKSTNPVVVGDRVRYEPDQEKDKGRITEVFERRNYIIRRASNLSKTYQIIAANIDRLFLLVTLKDPLTHPEFIDRYLVTAEAYSIPAVLVFNKTDLYGLKEKEKMQELIGTYEAIPYPCIPVSALNKINIRELIPLMKDQVNILAGVSGSGKSTLINRLDENLNLKTGIISAHHKAGRHITTFVEMHYLNFGAYVIDTPGIKGFGLTDMENEPIWHYFPEIFRASKRCRYHNCNHINEPDCEVISKVGQGSISPSRYRSYLSLVDEQNERSKYRR